MINSKMRLRERQREWRRLRKLKNKKYANHVRRFVYENFATQEDFGDFMKLKRETVVNYCTGDSVMPYMLVMKLQRYFPFIEPAKFTRKRKPGSRNQQKP